MIILVKLYILSSNFCSLSIDYTYNSYLYHIYVTVVIVIQSVTNFIQLVSPQPVD